MSQYLASSDVARLIGTSVDSVRRYARAGLLKSAATVRRGKRVDHLFRKEDVEWFKRERAAKTGHEAPAR